MTTFIFKIIVIFLYITDNMQYKHTKYKHTKENIDA